MYNFLDSSLNVVRKLDFNGALIGTYDAICGSLWARTVSIEPQSMNQLITVALIRRGTIQYGDFKYIHTTAIRLPVVMLNIHVIESTRSRNISAGEHTNSTLI